MTMSNQRQVFFEAVDRLRTADLLWMDRGFPVVGWSGCRRPVAFTSVLYTL